MNTSLKLDISYSTDCNRNTNGQDIKLHLHFLCRQRKLELLCKVQFTSKEPTGTFGTESNFIETLINIFLRP